jgi:hypothetical protein
LKRAATSWDLRACAEGRKKRVIRLCDPCDIALNRLVLEFANVAQVDRVIAEYAAERAS